MIDATGVIRTLQGLLGGAGLWSHPPDDPFPTLRAWLDDARASTRYDDPNAMVLATATPDAVPSARVVLCKDIEPDAITFFTNYDSRKGRELAANPRAAAVFHWPHARRQARVEGTVERLTDPENDAYFATRPLLSRIGAVASRQSEVLPSRADLLQRALAVAGSSLSSEGVRRPSWWGGFRLRASAVELWCAGEGRLHDRVRWLRTSTGWSHDLLWP
jgi:pyridoxamine 5'-phosphate oxidase